MLDPFALEKASNNEFLPCRTMVRFSPGSPVVITGDVVGDVKVYRLHGI